MNRLSPFDAQLAGSIKSPLDEAIGPAFSLSRNLKNDVSRIKAAKDIGKRLAEAHVASEQVLWKGEEELNSYKKFKRVAKQIQAGWEVRFRYGTRERQGKILAVSNGGVVCLISIMSNTRMKHERTFVKCEHIVGIFRDEQ